MTAIYMNEPMNTLKPCPFCGSKSMPRVLRSIFCDWLDQNTVIDGFFVVCDASFRPDVRGCGATTGWQESRKAAITSWNERNATGLDTMPDTTHRVSQDVKTSAWIGRAGNERPSGGFSLNAPVPLHPATPRTEAVLDSANFGIHLDGSGRTSPEEACFSELLNLCRKLEIENQIMAQAIVEIEVKEASMSFLDEAFNSGDGAYRP